MVRRRIGVSAVVVGLVLAGGGCQGAATRQQALAQAGSGASTPRVNIFGNAKPMTYDELGSKVGAICENPGPNKRCVGGDYEIELLPSCGTPDDFYGGVSAPDGALLIDKAPPEDTVRRATLAKGQIVCIQAIARSGQYISYYYVTTMPVATVPGCEGNRLCETYGDRKTTWLTRRPEGQCRMVAAGRFEEACANGWIRDSAMEAFSEGI